MSSKETGELRIAIARSRISNGSFDGTKGKDEGLTVLFCSLSPLLTCSSYSSTASKKKSMLE